MAQPLTATPILTEAEMDSFITRVESNKGQRTKLYKDLKNRFAKFESSKCQKKLT
jgi:hypothetical protein